MSYSLLIDCKQQNIVQISHGVMDLILIFFPQFSSKYPRFGEEFGRVGESPMTQIPSPICLLKPQIWGIPPETVTLHAVLICDKNLYSIRPFQFVVKLPYRMAKTHHRCRILKSTFAWLK